MLASCVLALLMACSSSGEHEAGPDAGAVDGGEDATVAIAEPSPPMDPVLTPCPAGWETREVAGVAVCDPLPTDASPCPRDEFRFLGEPSCTPLGDACPSDDFPSDVPEGAVFVRAGAADGTGTRSAPLSSLVDALSRAPAGATIVLAKGTYSEPVIIDKSVSIRGACPERTILDGGSSDGPTVEVTASGVEIADIQLRGGSGVALMASAGDATLRQVIVERFGVGGVVADGDAHLTLDHVVIRRGFTSDGNVGIASIGRSRVEAHALVLDRLTEVGASAEEESEMVLEDVHVLGGRAPRPGAGLQVIGQALAIVTRALFDQTGLAGILVSGQGAHAEVRDTVFRDARTSTLETPFGSAIGANARASVDAARVLCERTADAAFVFPGGDAGTTAHLRDVVIVDTRAGAEQQARALSIGEGHEVDAERLLVAGGGTPVIYVSGETSSLFGRDIHVMDVADREARGAGTVLVQRGAALDAQRFHIERVTTTGLVALESATLTVEDLRVEHVARDSAGDFGRAVTVQSSTAVLRRAHLASIPDIGLFVAGERAHVVAEDVVIEDMKDCEECGSGRYGFGLTLVDGSLTAQRFAIADAPVCGLLVSGAPELSMTDGFLSDSEIAVCLQTELFDVEAFGRSWTLEGNTQALSATSLPVPDLEVPGN